MAKLLPLLRSYCTEGQKQPTRRHGATAYTAHSVQGPLLSHGVSALPGRICSDRKIRYAGVAT